MLDALEDAIRGLERDADLDLVDPRQLSSLADRLQGVVCTVLHRAQSRGEHRLSGRSATGWAADICGLSPTSASDRLCVGEQLAAMPRIKQALSTGEISYQKASTICHLRDKLREDLRPNIDEEWWVGQARESSVRNLRWLEQHVLYMIDPDRFDRQVEEDWEKRFLNISESGGMYHLTGVLEREGGAALKTAIESLSKRLGPEDTRLPKQRRADAIVEIGYQAMGKGTLPRRHGVRPHIAVTTTIEGLRGEVGAAASQLHNGMPISSRTVQRLACDGTLHRVLKADSMVIDVGRAKRTAQPAHWRGLEARHRTCAGPGCDRPLNWTYAHHIDFWSEGGHTNLHKMLPLCYHHHRLVHEGGWQVVMAGERIEFVPPEQPMITRRRWGERWAA